MLAQGDVNSDTHLTFWNEMDFLGDAQTANSNESNSYNLRIRNMYTTIDWDSLGLEVLAGQNWSLATAQQPRHHAAQRSGSRHDRRAVCRRLQLGPPAAAAHRQELEQGILGCGVD